MVTNFLNIYQAADEIEAERIQSLLEEEGFEARLFHSAVSQLPGVESHFEVAVLHKHKVKALAVIKQAIRDGIISEDGQFLEP